MERLRRSFWPVIGLSVVVFSCWLLYRELRGISLDDVLDRLAAIPPHRWALVTAATLLAYAALAWYDQIALLHLRRRVAWPFVFLSSFTTYALSHNIGASVVSGAVVRYRAYRTRGLTPAEIGVLIGLCAFTFALGTVVLGGLVLVLMPGLPQRFFDAPDWAGSAAGLLLLGAVALYVFGAWRGVRPVTIAGFHIYYPRLDVVARQLLIGPLELIGAAAIIYFALPEHANPGFLVVLGIFLASFSAALVSHAPGGLGVLELVFVTALPDIDPADLIAALIVFRIFYLLIPFALALVVVLAFESRQWKRRHARSQHRLG